MASRIPSISGVDPFAIASGYTAPGFSGPLICWPRAAARTLLQYSRLALTTLGCSLANDSLHLLRKLSAWLRPCGRSQAADTRFAHWTGPGHWLRCPLPTVRPIPTSGGMTDLSNTALGARSMTQPTGKASGSGQDGGVAVRAVQVGVCGSSGGFEPVMTTRTREGPVVVMHGPIMPTSARDTPKATSLYLFVRSRAR